MVDVRLIGRGTAAVVLMLLGAGCSNEAGPGADAQVEPQLVFSSDSEIGAVIPKVDADVPIVLGSLPLCLASKGRVTVDAVTGSKGSGIRISDFTMHKNEVTIGMEWGTLATFASQRETHVSTACDSSEFMELIIEVRKAEARTVTTDYLSVKYSNESGHGSLRIPYTITLCARDDRTTESCDGE